MTIKLHDRVRVVPTAHVMHSGLYGREGTVVRVFEDGKTFMVDLNWEAEGGSAFTSQGVLTSLFEDELELVKHKVEIELTAEDGISVYVDATSEELEFLERIAKEFTELQESSDRYTYAPTITVKKVK